MVDSAAGQGAMIEQIEFGVSTPEPGHDSAKVSLTDALTHAMSGEKPDGAANDEKVPSDAGGLADPSGENFRDISV